MSERSQSKESIHTKLENEWVCKKFRMIHHWYCENLKFLSNVYNVDSEI